MTHDELEQRLWELEYGLLTDEEGAALRERISAEPDVAQSYGRIRAQLALLSHASRIEESRIALKSPSDEPAERTKPDALAPNSQPTRRTHAYFWIRRAANWTIGVAASLLLGVLSWAAWDRSEPADLQVAHDPPMASMSEPLEPLIIQVDTPKALSREANNPITVWTSAPDGTSQSADLRFAVEDSAGTEYFYKNVKTDQSGRAIVELPRVVEDLAKLTVAAAVDSEKAWQLELPAAQVEYATHVSTDKPRYRPGDVVRYRSVTLSRFGLKADRDVAISYSITDPAGQEVAGANLSGSTEHGVGNGEFVLAPGSDSGRYTLIARSPENLFPDARRDFTVLKPLTRQYEVDVSWGKPTFEAGEQAQGKLAVRTLLGEPASDVSVNLRAYVDGRQMELQSAESATGVSGETQFNFALPLQIASSNGDLGIQLGQQDVVWKDIPLQADQVYVDFYPEGGDLVAGVESRVYFHCHDFDGRAVAIQGNIVDAADQVLAEAVTEHAGRGSFRLTPQAGANYSLVITDPGAITSRPALPAVVNDSRLVLDAGPAVFSGGSPLRLQLRSREAPSDFSIVATCRGVTVGQLSGTKDDFQNGVCEVTLPVIEEAAGVLRVTVFDYSKQSPEPLAERLVYRHPLRKLNLQFVGLHATYSPGETVAGEVLATNENGQPISTVLGLSAIDEMVQQLADPSPPRLDTRFLLFSELSQTDKLEDVNVYLAEDTATASALDLVLATQGWRRFERISAMGMAGRSLGVPEGLVLRRSAGLDGVGGGGAGGGGARQNKAGMDIAGKNTVIGDTTTENLAAGMLGGFGTNRLVEATEEAPKRYRNRIEVESLEKKRGSAAVDSDTIRFTHVQPAPYLPWVIAACAGLALVLVSAIVIRQHPTKRTLLAMAGVLGMIAILSAVILPVYWLSSGHGNAVARSGAEATQAESATPNETEKMRGMNPASGAGERFYADAPAATTAATPAEPSGARPATVDDALPNADFGVPAPESPGAAPAANAPADRPTADKPVAEKTTGEKVTGEKKMTRERETGEKMNEERAIRDGNSKSVPLPEPQAAEKQDAKKGSPVAPVKQKMLPLNSAAPSSAPPPLALQPARTEPPVPSPVPAPAPASPAPPEPAPAQESPPKPAALPHRAISPANRSAPGQGVAPKPGMTEGAAAAGGIGGVPKTDPALKKEMLADQKELSKEFDASQSRMDRKADEVEKRFLMELKYSELQDQQQAEDKRMRQATESNKTNLGNAVLNKALKSSQSQRASAGIPVVPEAADAESSRSVPALKANPGKDLFVIRRFANARAKDSRRNESDFDFTESVLWNPLIVTDEGGRARFQFDLPDTITSFRVMADGHADGRLGSADQLLKSTREN